MVSGMVGIIMLKKIYFYSADTTHYIEVKIYLENSIKNYLIFGVFVI